MEELFTQWHLRSDIVNRVVSLLEMQTPFPIHIWGGTGNGKTCLVRDTVSALASESQITRHVYINTHEHHSARSLFESAVDRLHGHIPSKSNDFSGFRRCEDIAAFLRQMRELKEHEFVVLVVDNAEKLLTLQPLLVTNLTRLDEKISARMCVVFISRLPWNHFEIAEGCALPAVSIHVPNYTDQDLVSILNSSPCAAESPATFTAFATMLVKMSTGITHHPPELLHLAERLWGPYFQPVRENRLLATDSAKLFMEAKPQFQAALNSIHLRGTDLAGNNDGPSAGSKANRSLELPKLGMLTVIGCFLASFVPPKFDLRLFGGRSRIVLQTRKKQRAARNPNQQPPPLLSSPAIFQLERLIAIVFAISGERRAAPSVILQQVNQLVYMRLLTQVTDSLDGPRYRCNCTRDLAFALARELDINLGAYLPM